VQRTALILATLFCLLMGSCFKRHVPNENALLQQKSCIESIELKDYQRAQTHCELCLEYESSMPQCLNAIGLIALAMNDEPKAIKFFSQALRQDNDFCEARNNLGVTYFSHGEFNKALKYFDRALAINPSNTDARYNSALSHFRIAERFRAYGQFNKSVRHLLVAKEQINKLLALEPTYSHAFRDLGLIELNLYDQTEFEEESKSMLAEAEKAFANCLAVDRSNDGCYEGMGQVKTEQAKFSEAFAQYFLCLTFDPDNTLCRKGIVFAFEKSAQAEGGYEGFKDQLHKNPGNALAHEAFCSALFERGLDSEAVRQCELAISLKPQLCWAHYRLADYFASVFNAKRAREHCQEYLICDRDNKLDKQRKCQEIISLVKR